MKIKHWLTALCALSMALLLTVPAAAEDDTGVSGTTATSEALDNIDLGSTGGVGGTAVPPSAGGHPRGQPDHAALHGAGGLRVMRRHLCGGRHAAGGL